MYICIYICIYTSHPFVFFSILCKITTEPIILATFLEDTSPAGSLLAVKLHSENGVIFKGKYEILISLILQWQDNPRKTMRNQLS